MHRRFLSLASVVVCLALLAPMPARAPRAHAAPGLTLRMGMAGAGVGGRPFLGGTTVTVAYAQGLIERALSELNVAVEWTFVAAGGTAINELFANRLIDMAWQGDMPAVIGRASGLRTSVLLASGARANTYVVVASDSNIKSIAELRNKRVALGRSTNVLISGMRVLRRAGLDRDEVKLVNVDGAAAENALMTGAVDAIIAGVSAIQIEYRKMGRILYSTKGQPSELKRHAYMLTDSAFASARGDVVQRVVTAVVKACHWSSQEKNRFALFTLWGKSGTPPAVWTADYEGEPLRVRASPLLDAAVIEHGQRLTHELVEEQMIARPFDFERWLDDSYLQRSLRTLDLEKYWQ